MIKDKRVIIGLAVLVILLAIILMGVGCAGHFTNNEENGAVLQLRSEKSLYHYRSNSLNGFEDNSRRVY